MALNNMVLIQGGIFEMGATEEQMNVWRVAKPVHQVSLYSYYLSKYAVTFEQYDAFCEAIGREKPSDMGWGRGMRPAINISWCDAIEYCNWLSEQYGLEPCYQIDKAAKHPNNSELPAVFAFWVYNANGFRLPTEAEWEYAARVQGKKILFGNSQNIADPEEINFDPSEKYPYSIDGIGRACTVPVDSFNPNDLGLFNMSGNVWEWCWDWYDEYSEETLINPKGPKSGTFCVIRGGSWFDDAESLEVSNRGRASFNDCNDLTGFRLARTLI